VGRAGCGCALFRASRHLGLRSPGQLGEQQVIFNRYSMVVADTKVEIGRPQIADEQDRTAARSADDVIE
jgi:hypothetical protein